MNNLSRNKNILKIISYVFCAVAPLYIYSLFISLRIFTTYPGGIMNSGPSTNSALFIILLIILSLVQIFLLKKIAGLFGILSSQKIIIIINIISYIATLTFLSSTLKFQSALIMDANIINMPVTLLIPAITLIIINFIIILVSPVAMENRKSYSSLIPLIIASAMCIIGIYSYYNWNYGGIMTINEIQQYGIKHAKEAEATKISEGDITATDIEIKEENVIRLYRIFALQKIDKVLSVKFTEIFYFTDSAEEKAIVDEIAAKNKKIDLFGNSITYGRNETSNIDLVYKDAERNSKFPYEIYSSFDISVDRYSNEYKKPDLNEARLNIMNPIIKNVAEGDNISYKKLIQVFRDNGYSVVQLPDVYDDF